VRIYVAGKVEIILYILPFIELKKFFYIYKIKEKILWVIFLKID